MKHDFNTVEIELWLNKSRLSAVRPGGGGRGARALPLYRLLGRRAAEAGGPVDAGAARSVLANT